MPSDADDGYEPALDSTTTADTGVESEAVVPRSASPAAVEAARIGEAQGADGDATLEQGPRLPRQRSDKGRAMFRDLVKQVQAGEVSVEGDLEPMQHAAPAAKAVAAPVVAAAPAPAAVAAPAAPVTPPPGLPPLPAMPLPALPTPAPVPAAPDPQHAAREAQLTAREAQLVEREKLMPDRMALAERPVDAFIAWMKDVHGITDEADMKAAIEDFVTEASEKGLGITLPSEVKTKLESRKALRSVRAYKATLDKDKASLAEQRAAHEKAEAESRATAEQTQRDSAYVARIAELIAPAAAQHKFLHDPEVTGGLAPQAIVYEVLKEQKRLGQEPDLARATEYANSYYKSQAEAVAKKAAHFQSLLAPATPAPAAAPATAAASPGGVPGPAPKQPAAPAPMEWDPSDLPMDRQQRRQASLARIVAAKKAAAHT